MATSTHGLRARGLRPSWLDRHKFAVAFAFLVLLLASLALVVGLGGKGGQSIHPRPAPAASRAPGASGG